MIPMANIRRYYLWLVPVFLGCALSASAQDAFSVLVFSKTTGFRHDSIPAGVAAIQAMGKEQGFLVDATEDDAFFTTENLRKYRSVVFLSTTGDVLNADEKSVLENYIRSGGGFVGIHSATDTEYHWPWYGQLVGTYFARHPDIQSAKLTVVGAVHPSTEQLPREWVRTDEWYDFQEDPSSRVSVLVTIDESSYAGGGMGPNHPISWYHNYDGGRAWYTAMGHTTESYSDPLFLNHVLGGILWAAKAEGRLKSGYAIITPNEDSCCPNATLTFANISDRAVQSKAAMPAGSLTTDASLDVAVNASSSENLGLAMVNPGPNINTIALTLRDSSGGLVRPPATVQLQPGQQVARFVTEFFTDIGITPFRGALQIQAPAAVSVVGLRFSGSSFSTVSPSNASAEVGVPPRTLVSGTVGGRYAVMFPQFAIGAGWVTEITLANNSGLTLSGRLDVFNRFGNPMFGPFNGLNQSTYMFSITPGGFAVFKSPD